MRKWDSDEQKFGKQRNTDVYEQKRNKIELTQNNIEEKLHKTGRTDNGKRGREKH